MARSLDTVLLFLRKVLVIEDQLTSAGPKNFLGLCILQTQYDNYDYDVPESR